MPSTGALPPSLPSAPPLTAAAAARWRVARTAGPPTGGLLDGRRLDTRWLALVPLLFFVLAGAFEPVPVACTPEHPCVSSWWGALAAFSVVAEAVLLLARPRGLAAVPVVVAALVWYLPDSLQNGSARLAALLVHGFLAAVLIGAELGRRRARQQFDGVTGGPVPYPWTFAGLPSPVPAPARWQARRLPGLLLLVLALLTVLVGLSRQADSDHHAAGATRVEGTVLSTDPYADTARIAYRLPDGGAQRILGADILWQPLPAPGDPVPLLADGTGWARVEQQPYDPTDLAVLGGLLGLLGLLLLGSARSRVRARRGFGAPGAPAVEVSVSSGGRRDLLVGPVDGTAADRPLWRLRTCETYAWDGERWIGGAAAPPGASGGTRGLGGAVDDGVPDDGAAPSGTLPPGPAVLALTEVNRPVHALLYQGPDGPHAQLLLRPRMLTEGPGAAWLAVVCRADVLAPPLVRRRPHALEERLAVPALAARAVEDAPPSGPPLPARRWEMPLGLRLTAGPLVALLLSLPVALLVPDSVPQGLVHPLVAGIPVLLFASWALTWQVAMDGYGITVTSALGARRVPWERVNAAAVHRHALAVQLTDGRELRIPGRAARLLSGHLGGPYDPQEVAAAVTTAAQWPERRPAAELRQRLVSPQLLVNRVALTAYVLFVVARCCW